MATDTAPKLPPAVHGVGQAVRFLRKDFTYANDGQTLVIGTVPAGSVIIKPMSGVMVSTIFDGNATNTADIGYSTDSGTNNLGSALSLATATFVPLDEATTGDFYVSSETIISMLVTSTASAAAGVGQAIICFVESHQTN